MEDEPKNPPSDNGNGHESDTTIQERQQQSAARLLQVTLAPVDTGEKEDHLIGEVDGSTTTPSNVGGTTPSAADAIAPFPAATVPSTAEDEYVLQGPAAVSSDRSIEIQIERDIETLTESEKQEMYFDIRGNNNSSKDESSSISDESTALLIDKMQQEMEAPIQQDEIDALNCELLRLLEDPEEQERNPFYERIRKTLTSSGSDFYANSFGFRKRFLRAERRDTQKAARRTADYLALLWESFGETMLGRPILISDLNPTERQLQRKGHQQLFRFRDQSLHNRSGNDNQASSAEQSNKQGISEQQRLQDLDNGAGRRIAGSFDLCRCLSHSEPSIDDETTKTRVLLYMMQVASDDEETQTQGIVFIFMLAIRAIFAHPSSIPATDPTPAAVPAGAAAAATTKLQRSDSVNSNIFANDSNSDSDEQILAQLQFSPYERSNRHSHTLTRVAVLSKIFRCGPVRVAAIHVCSPSRTELQPVKFEFLKALHRYERVRTRFHNGTSMECSLSLNKVGVPTDRLPLKYDGTIKIDDHLQWIAIQEAKESAAKQKRPFNVVECPMNMDVLSGRGQLVRSHPGNVSFRKDFIRARSARYDMAANREEKNSIADEILDDISTLRRRFLKQHPGAGYWTELDKKTAKEKVMMAFREFRKSQRNQQQQQQLRKTASRQSPSVLQHHHQHVRPSLTLSQSLHHSPVSQPTSRQSQSRSPSIPLSMSQKSLHDHHQVGQSQGQPDHRQHMDQSSHHSPQQQQQPQDEFHYPPFHPSSSTALGPIGGEPFHHPPHHIPIPTPSMPGYYLPHHPPLPPHHPHPLGYGHPIPPHLLHPPHLPPPHHAYHPPPPHPTETPQGGGGDGASSNNNHLGDATTAPGGAPPVPPDAATLAYTIGGAALGSQQQVPPPPHLMGYNPHAPAPPLGYLPPMASSRPSSRDRGMNEEGGDDPNQRSYKRYRTM